MGAVPKKKKRRKKKKDGERRREESNWERKGGKKGEGKGTDGWKKKENAMVGGGYVRT